jgi:trehalose 6-phosphate phosphatase
MTRELQLRDIQDAIAHFDRVFIASDFDGTLCPIASSPDLVQVPSPMAMVLRQLSTCPKVVLAIISGRSLKDVQRRVGIEAIYGGNHGLELSGKGIEFLHPDALRIHEHLDRLCDEIHHAIADWPNAWVENKSWTATVHMRAVPIEQWPALISCVNTHMFGKTQMFEVRSGLAALEIIPSLNWNKGSALNFIRERLGLEKTLTICIGDDTTDEFMFRAVSNGLTIRVGPYTRTDAEFHLSTGVEGVTWLLNQVIALLDTAPSRSSVWRAPRGGGQCRRAAATFQYR